MSKELSESSSEERPGQDLLRALAGYPSRAVHLARWTTDSRIILIQRDALGNVIGSTERIQQDQYTALDGDWIN